MEDLHRLESISIVNPFVWKDQCFWLFCVSRCPFDTVPNFPGLSVVPSIRLSTALILWGQQISVLT